MPRSYNFEIKAIDGTANPYLALSAILAAGMLGVKSSSPLKVKSCLGVYHSSAANIDDPGNMGESERSALGITKTLPKRLLDAWKYLQEDKAMVEVLGETFVGKYLSVKKAGIVMNSELIQ